MSCVNSNLVRRTGTYLRSAKRVIQRQQRVVELMSLPNFQDEDKELPIAIDRFEHLVLRDIQFSYNRVPPYALRLQQEIRVRAPLFLSTTVNTDDVVILTDPISNSSRRSASMASSGRIVAARVHW